MRNVYLRNLNEEEFNIIWSKLYTSYWDDEISYSEIANDYEELKEESSY